MPAQRCSNGKWKWGQRGSCVFDTEEQAERAGRAIERSTLRMQDSYKPTDGMVAEAERGLSWRREYGRGGTEVGLARARDISNRKNLPLDTVKRMKAYFDRHEVDKKGKGWSPGEDGYPSNGRIAWALWGGDAGWAWAKNIVKRSQSLENG
jgi:hypothetical protein